MVLFFRWNGCCQHPYGSERFDLQQEVGIWSAGDVFAGCVNPGRHKFHTFLHVPCISETIHGC